MCSRRSCPTQNALPVPVRTTTRTSTSSATRCRVESSSSLVGVSSAFMASARLNVTVATPPLTSSSTGAAAWSGVVVVAGCSGMRLSSWS